MRRAQLVVGFCMLMALPSALLAQRRGPGMADAASTDAAQLAVRPARGGMASRRAAVGRLQRSVMNMANRLENRSQSGNADNEWIEAQALRIQARLRFGLRQLDRAGAIATPAEKRHLALIRSDESEELAIADELVADTHKPKREPKEVQTAVQKLFAKIQTSVPVAPADDWTK